LGPGSASFGIGSPPASVKVPFSWRIALKKLLATSASLGAWTERTMNPRVEDEPGGAAADSGKVTVAAWVERSAEQTAPRMGARRCSFMFG
jgi:hypothetical protein